LDYSSAGLAGWGRELRDSSPQKIRVEGFANPGWSGRWVGRESQAGLAARVSVGRNAMRRWRNGIEFDILSVEKN
jgi:hypothetical protein